MDRGEFPNRIKTGGVSGTLNTNTAQQTLKKRTHSHRHTEARMCTSTCSQGVIKADLTSASVCNRVWLAGWITAVDLVPLQHSWLVCNLWFIIQKAVTAACAITDSVTVVYSKDILHIHVEQLKMFFSKLGLMQMLVDASYNPERHIWKGIPRSEIQRNILGMQKKKTKCELEGHINVMKWSRAA